MAIKNQANEIKKAQKQLNYEINENGNRKMGKWANRICRAAIKAIQ